jgi:hypothetical protein
MSKIDWAKLKTVKPKTDPLFAIIFGASGAGKSTALGTSGLSTLLLHGPTENHAGTNARLFGREKVFPLEYTVRNDKGNVDADATFKNLLAILKDGSIAQEFDAVALDSWTEVQTIIGETREFREACLTDKGKHNKFAESDEYTRRLNQIVHSLLALHGQGLHILTTCAAIIKDSDAEGSDVSAKPNLKGWSVGEDLVRNFPDVLYVQLVRVTNDKGDEVSKHKFLFNPKVTAEAKDTGGRTTKVSFSNFAPRISHFKREDLPHDADVDLSKIIKSRSKRNEP